MGKFCLRDTAGSPERAGWLHLARSGSQSQRAIWFILPARGTSHIITGIIIWQDRLEVNPSVLIGSFLVGILPYGPFPWKRSYAVYFLFSKAGKFKLRKEYV